MLAVVTTGIGGLDRLDYRAVRRPQPDDGEVLVRVLAAGVNTTEINTRVGWYEDGGWNAPTPFPFIQGTDCCGRVTEVGVGADPSLWVAACSSGRACVREASRRWTPCGWAPTSTARSPSSSRHLRPRCSR